MSEIIIAVVFLIPSMLGVAELLHILKVYIISPKHKPKKYLLIFLSEEFSPEQLVMSIEEMKWQGRKYAENIIAVDCNLDAATQEHCRRIAEVNNIIFCSAQNLCSTVKSL